MNAQQTSIRVDFNNFDEDGLVFARLARAIGPVAPGDEVIALDGEGEIRTASVVRIEDHLVFLSLEPSAVGSLLRTSRATANTRFASVTYTADDLAEAVTDSSDSPGKLVVGVS